VSASKNAVIQARLSCRRLNSVKIISEPIATRYTALKVIRSNINGNNSATDCSIAFKFGTEFYHVTGDTLQMFKIKCQRSRSQHKVMYQQQKRYNTAMDRCSEWQRLQTWHGVVIKAEREKDWPGSGGLKLQCIRNCHVF